MHALNRDFKFSNQQHLLVWHQTTLRECKTAPLVHKVKIPHLCGLIQLNFQLFSWPFGAPTEGALHPTANQKCVDENSTFWSLLLQIQVDVQPLCKLGRISKQKAAGRSQGEGQQGSLECTKNCVQTHRKDRLFFFSGKFKGRLEMLIFVMKHTDEVISAFNGAFNIVMVKLIVVFCLCMFS